VDYIPFPDAAEAGAPQVIRTGSNGSHSSAHGPPSTYDQSNEHVPGNWQEDKNSCNLCRVPIGKFLRHHCRICGRCVCASCSPSSVQIEGVHKGPQRACRACVSNVLLVPAMTQRFGLLSGQLMELSGDRRPRAEVKGIEEAADRCEAGLLQVEEAFTKSMRRAERAEGAAAAACSLVQRMLLGMQTMPGVDEDLGANRKPTSLEDLEDAGVASQYALTAMREALETQRGRGSRTRSRSGGRGNIPRTSSVGKIPRANSSNRVAVGRLASTTSVGSFGGASEGGDSDQSEKFVATANRLRRSILGRGQSDQWDEDATNCSVCDTKIGKRVLKPRHHCRICRRCVCSGCSPSSIHMDGEKHNVRVCTPCVAETPQLPALARRENDLWHRIVALGQEGAPPTGKAPSTPGRPGGLDQALNLCEIAFANLEDNGEQSSTLC